MKSPLDIADHLVQARGQQGEAIAKCKMQIANCNFMIAPSSVFI
jgi:hypothetical protein